MEVLRLSDSDEPFASLQRFIRVSDTAAYLQKNRIAIAVILDHVKANDWPWKDRPLTNDPVRHVPILWGLLRAGDDSHLSITYDLHPAKCFPLRYMHHNESSACDPVPIVAGRGGTLAGCARVYVTMAGRKYEVFEKTPLYCSVFGLPDDCYDEDFEDRMVEVLRSQEDVELWCFEKTDYMRAELPALIELRQMKEEFLPSTYFMYSDTAEHFLKGIFSAREMECITQEYWYQSGRELLDELNLESADPWFRFEESAVACLRTRLLYQLVRLLLLLMNRDSFRSFWAAGPQGLNLDREDEVTSAIACITAKAEEAAVAYIDRTLKKIANGLDLDTLKKSRFMVMDVEYIHSTYPGGSLERSFNFPCIFSNLVWKGPRDGLKVDISLFVLPCHFCTQVCSHVKGRSAINFDCLAGGAGFIERQASLIETMLLRYEGFKMYTYGRSDVFQLEQGSCFFSDTFDIQTYRRKNRKRARRIVELSEDLAVAGTSLGEIEDRVLKGWLTGWSRPTEKLEVNPRFMKRYGDPAWESSYSQAVESCSSDAISAFLYLMHKKYRTSENTIQF